MNIPGLPALPQEMLDTLNHGAGFQYEIQWLFEDDSAPAPHRKIVPDLVSAMIEIMGLANAGRIPVHLAITRQLA